MPTLQELAWLASPEGRTVCTEMAREHPADTPRAIERWRERLDAERVSAAWTQVTLRAAAGVKFSRAENMLFDRVGLEQSSDECVATHKAQRFAGCSAIADLCCGIGGDTLALASIAPVTALDASGPRTIMAEHNAGAYGRRATGIIGSVELTHPEADAAHIDPDRRPAGRREHQVEHGSPDLPTVEAVIHRYHHVAVKLSPGADFSRLPFDAEIELISHHGHCKQAVAWTGRFQTALHRATVLPTGETISAMCTAELAWPEPRPVEPGLYLLEPDAAVIRAHLVGVLAQRLGCHVIDPHIAWLVAEHPLSSPFVSTFHVVDVVPFAEKTLRAWLAAHDVGSVDIKTRGTAFRPEDLAKRLRLTGNRHMTLLITRLGTHPVAIIAERMPA